MGKIPTIVHNSTVITESAAICMYLADIFPSKQLAPELASPHRGAYLRWFLFAASCLEPAVLDKNFPRVKALPSGHLGYGNYADVMKTLEVALAPGFILGNQFSAVDVFIASSLQWYLMNKQIEAKPVFTQYVKKCCERPAFQKMTKQAGEIRL